MNKQWTDTLRGEIEDFKETIRAFDQGEIDRKAYKGVSGGLGSYAQRDASKHMLRLRLPGGRLTLERLKFLTEVVEREQVGRMKLTTCETISSTTCRPIRCLPSWPRRWAVRYTPRGAAATTPAT